ncbi:hypothetical protein PRIPAC_92979 [Pristionchus pacificus]|uniref:Phospholipase B-like n=1 Tax=Pristionchus pacificus TaxID=54126 RepID=A0A2A6BR90_PRIPA|nr:hypothetical protein PRIPAC_92979 [Pristionchus pacificus]|eukprot:PDM68387.1 hypothetical protein PRIPAC_46431 [Pristionchus pacificus]
MSRQLLFSLVVLPLLLLSATLHEHHDKHGGHKREYIMCQTSDGELYFYKNKGDSDSGYTSCDVDIAKAQLVNSINTTGWGLLDVEIASDKVPEWLQGYAAGFVEGRTTRDLIALQIYNTAEEYCDGAEDYCNRLAIFLLQNLQYMREQIEKNPKDIYWRHVNVSINQFAGMIDGYHGKINQKLSDNDLVIHPLYLIQLAGDIEDLEVKLGKPKHLRRTWIGSGHCSALVKVDDKNTNLLFSHVTWSSYSSMLRLQKRYRFKLHHTPGNTYTFSSYPGSIPSVDDFMLTSSKLAIFETTISNYNKKIMNHTTPSTLLCWVRSQLATRLSSSAEEWAVTFSRHNSGTYNNQWVIVDYKKFRPGAHKLQRGLIHVLEQLPGYVQHADMTAHLNKKRFWPSYNMPYFPDIYEDSQTAALADKYGDWFTYDKTPRALIFARDEKSVVDVDSMRRLMRSNNYMQDPLSRCDCNPPYSAENAIACRSDLNPANGTYPFEALAFRDHGATDVKITDINLIETLSFDAVAGPTYDPTPIFSWKTTPFKDSVRHAGQPDEFRFGPLKHIWDQRSLYA